MKRTALLFSLVVGLGGLTVDAKEAASKKRSVEKSVKANIDIDSYITSKSDLKVRYIDTLAVMRDSQEGVKVAKQLEEKRQELAARIEAKEKEFTKAAQEFRSKASMMKQAARDKEEQRLMRMETDYKALVQSSEQELKLTMQRVTERLAQGVDRVVEKIAKREELDAVVDKMTGRVLFTSVKADYTAKVVNAMDKDYKVRIAKADRAEKEATA